MHQRQNLVVSNSSWISKGIGDLFSVSSGACASMSESDIDEVLVDADFNGITLVANIITFVVIFTTIGNHC